MRLDLLLVQIETQKHCLPQGKTLLLFKTGEQEVFFKQPLRRSGMTPGSRPVFLCFWRISQRDTDLVPPDRQNLAACTLFLQWTDLWENGVCSGSSPFPIFRLRSLLQTLSRLLCSCFHACLIGDCFLQQHPAHVTSSSTPP